MVTPRLAQRGDDAEDLAHDQRRQAQAGLVEHQQLGRDISARPTASICRSPPDSVPASCVRRSFRRGNSS
jgi:hypothetical protein